MIVARAGTVGISVLINRDLNDTVFGSYLIKVKLKEGINPKFGELAVLLNSLGIENGVIALTKTDSSTSDEIESLKTKLKAVFAESKLKDAEMIGTSSITDDGFTELKSELVKLESKSRDEDGKFKMPIEIAKDIKSGFTTIFGVIDSGKLKKYDKTLIMPWGKEFIVQEIERAGEIVEEAKAGDRVGILFKGLYPWDVQTGDIVTVEGVVEKAKKMKIEINIIPFFKDELKKGSEVKLNIGVQTFPVIINKMIKDGADVESGKPGEKVELEVESKLPFAFNKGQRCVVVNPEAHWRSIKIVGFGSVKEGLE